MSTQSEAGGYYPPLQGSLFDDVYIAIMRTKKIFYILVKKNMYLY